MLGYNDVNLQNMNYASDKSPFISDPFVISPC